MRAAAAGVAISIGGIAFLATGNAWFFTIGLLMVCYFGFNLYTGKIPYAKSYKEIPKLFLMLVINILAASLFGVIIHYVRPDLVETAEKIANIKSNYPWWGMLIRAFMCNVMIFVAVEFWKTAQHYIVKFFGLIFATAIFILCGFEHCIANAFYFGVALSNHAMGLPLLLNVLGNTIGGLAAYNLVKFVSYKEVKADELLSIFSNQVFKSN